MAIEKLVELSNKYGADASFVLAGGGNTSFKDQSTLYVTGSGTSLATITERGFVKMSREKLAAMFAANYPADDAGREAAALSDMMAARLPGEENKRPSVEALLHSLLPFAYVLHVHPALVNGLTCGRDGEKQHEKLFDGKAVWIPVTKPGYTLACACKKALEEYKAKNGKEAQIILLENHGIFFAANTTEEIDALTAFVMGALKAALKAAPDESETETDKKTAASIVPVLRMLYGKGKPASASFFASALTEKFTQNEAAFEPLRLPFTPDHLVYYKSEPLFIKKDADIKEAFGAFVAQKGYAPRIAAIEGLGVVAMGESMKVALTAKQLFIDACKIAVYSESFGGFKQMPRFMVDFIANWEVENYRSKVAAANGNPLRMAEKIAIVTGSAQGFGKGIAEELAAQGAYIVVADLNIDGAKAYADDLCARYGKGKATSVKVNVYDEESVEGMMQECALYFGGLDVLVSNAGVLKAGGLDEMDKKSFEFVTSINYTGYFLCTKYASAVMKLQHKYAPEYFMDIIEINSKSGLQGSNKNFAYAGGKFGGIGLTQSFAMELIGSNIKVNAVCPGNFYDGPLWSDPERGLFVQYLKAGKVPGAKTMQDVKDFYLAKSPIHRGCLPKDVATAIFYACEQTFETGQAIPVTGGQVMLK